MKGIIFVAYLMKSIIIFISCLCLVSAAAGQAVLPDVVVKESGGKVIISWLNDYKKPVSVISIQRSYDSLRNFTTIGAVLNPQNLENGYLDKNPPYNKMYYRVFISFEGGAYVYSRSLTPTVEIITETIKTKDGNDSVVVVTNPEPQPWMVDPKPDPTYIDPNLTGPKGKALSKLVHNYGQDVVLDLPYAATRKYQVQFLDETGKLVLEIKDFKETFLIIEKVNFKRSGTYNFELYEDGILIEENIVVIAKDAKPSSKK